MKKKYEFDELVNELIEKGEGVKGLLTDMKDLSGLMVDLSYSAVLYNNDDLARAVKELEEVMDNLRYQVEVRAMLAAKTPMQATKLIGILKLAAAIENIGNSAERVAEIVLRDIDIHPAVREAIREARRLIEAIEIKRGSKCVGDTVAHLRKEYPGISIPALKQNGEWTIKPHDEIKIKAGDLIIVSGTRESVETVRKL